MKKSVRHFWAAYSAFAFFVPLIGLYPVFWYLLKISKNYKAANKLRRHWARIVLHLAFVRKTIEIEEPFDTTKPYIITANHSSYLDIISLALAFHERFSFMAKSELKKVPLMGIFFGTVDIAVNRKSAFDSHKAYVIAKEKLESGWSLILFPEGTISKQAPNLSRFKNGAFKLAIETGVDILPITLPDNCKLLPDDGSFTAKPGKMRIFIHRPVSVKGLNIDDVETLKKNVFNIIENKLRKEGITTDDNSK